MILLRRCCTLIIVKNSATHIYRGFCNHCNLFSIVTYTNCYIVITRFSLFLFLKNTHTFSQFSGKLANNLFPTCSFCEMKHSFLWNSFPTAELNKLRPMWFLWSLWESAVLSIPGNGRHRMHLSYSVSCSLSLPHLPSLVDTLLIVTVFCLYFMADLMLL